MNHILKWYGSTLSAPAGSAGSGMEYQVYALAAFDDGNGSALFAGGSFTTAGGLPSRYIARWGCVSLPGSVFADDFESGDAASTWNALWP